MTEFMCHPSELDEELERLSTYARQRYRELASLVDPAVGEKVREFGLVRSRLGDLR